RPPEDRLALTFLFADDEGFEPPEVLPSLVFKTNAIVHSTNHPKWCAVSQPASSSKATSLTRPRWGSWAPPAEEGRIERLPSRTSDFRSQRTDLRTSSSKKSALMGVRLVHTPCARVQAFTSLRTSSHQSIAESTGFEPVVG